VKEESEEDRDSFVQYSFLTSTLPVVQDHHKRPCGLTMRPSGTKLYHSSVANSRRIGVKLDDSAQSKDLAREIQKALEDFASLRKYIPICAWCKKVRSDDGVWREDAILSRLPEGIGYSHGICPECAEKVLGQTGEKKS
jgi:hypothetical protein